MGNSTSKKTLIGVRVKRNERNVGHGKVLRINFHFSTKCVQERKPPNNYCILKASFCNQGCELHIVRREGGDADRSGELGAGQPAHARQSFYEAVSELRTGLFIIIQTSFH